jgi:molybdopterin adenylyltransferase
MSADGTAALSGYAEHRERVAAEGARSLRCGVVTVSDSRTPDTDASGRMIIERLTHAGHEIARYEVVKDDAAQIVELVHALAQDECAVVILNGGTGIARRDSTFDAIDRLLEKRLPGFGELFRMLSYQEIGPAAMLSRATAGVYHGTLIFSLPGSPNAVEVAMDRLILPELTHLVWETVRK